MATFEGLLTIEELASAVESALAAQPPGQLNGRVRAVPDVRTLRYYTTLGLLDRPAEMKGRTALYGFRHLLQLVAIKRLQAQGRSLADIQARLINAGDEEMARLAELPADFAIDELPVTTKAAEESTSSREPARAFWKVLPARAAAAPTDGAGAAPPELPPPVLLGLPLDAAASLLVHAARPLNEEDAAAILAAAQPLLDLLRHRRLIE
jgi:DNA-binding transcriptional MerR regulator